MQRNVPNLGLISMMGLASAALLLAPACAMEVGDPAAESDAPYDDEVEVAGQTAALTNTSYVRWRFIPLRFVQFESASGATVPLAKINEKILHANGVFAKAGIHLYLRANHIVKGSAFRELLTCDASGNCTEQMYRWPSPPSSSTAISPFRPDCPTFEHPEREEERVALARAASYCGFDDEILVYVSDSDSTGGQYPWESRILGIHRAYMDNPDTDNVNFPVFAHEIGHYLGLPHTFPGTYYGLTNDEIVNSDANTTLYNPETGQRAKLWNFWDLVYKPSSEAPVTSTHRFFSSEAEARAAANAVGGSGVGFFQPIEAVVSRGYLCGTNDGLCQKPDGTFAPRTALRMVVGLPNSSERQEVHFTGSPALKAFTFPSGSGYGVNIMSYGYPGVPRNHWAAQISDSQVTQILRSLRYDIESKDGPAAGKHYGHRPMLGDIFVRSWEGYDMLVGIDEPGNDYDDFEMPEPIPAICRNACLQETACKAYTYVAPRNGFKAHCWLKSTSTSGVVCPECISGDAQGWQVGFNLYGSDYKGVAGLARPEECQAACGRETRCRAYTWVKPGVQGPSAQCWLKEVVPVRNADNNCTSGVRHSLRNVNLLGIDYRGFVPSPNNEQTCMDACAREERCVGYTYRTTGCRLKSSVATTQAESGATSGVKRGVDKNTYLVGNVISTATVSSPRTCQNLCANNAGCVGWNHTKLSLGAVVCQQLSTITASNMGSGTTSGLKGMEFF